MKQGRKPSMEEVAAEAMVSRATAYRYFSTLEALLVEAPLDSAVPDPDALFAGDPSTDPGDRTDKAEAALHAMCYQSETPLRLMLAMSLEQSVRSSGNKSLKRSDKSGDGGGSAAGSGGDDEGSDDGREPAPLRQNRRLPLIEAALAPARPRFDPKVYERLCAALSLIFGVESMVVFRDVVPLDEAEARQVKSWALRALVQTALKDSRRNR
jgi:hypothetical protein